MKNTLALLKLQIDNRTNLLKMRSPKVMILAILRALAILVGATLLVSFGLSSIIGIGVNINAELLSIVLLVTQAVSLIFATGNVINTLYLSQDNQMLMCLPVTPNQLFISKLLMIYINELAVNAVISVPLFVTLGSFSHFDFSYYYSIPILLILLPILPIVVAAFISIPLMSVIKFLKKHAVLSIISVFSLIAVCLWIYISFIGSIAGEFNIAYDQYNTARKINQTILQFGSAIPMYYQIGGAMVSLSKWYIYPILLVGAVALSALTVVFTRYFFFKIAMSTLENTVKKTKGEKKDFKKRGHLSSMFLKEIFCVFRSPSDVFEYFLFTLLMPFIVFSYDKLLMSISLKVTEYGTNMIAGAHVMVVAILAMLSNISSASAISRDGMNFYTSKIVPVNYYSQIFAKFLFNAVFTVGAVILTTVVSIIADPTNVMQFVLGAVAVVFASVGHIAYSIDTDIKNPTPNLVGDEKAGTVSKSTPKSLIYGVVLGFILGMIVMLLSMLKVNVIPYILIIILSIIFMVYRVHTLVLRINMTYDKIEM